MKPKTGTQVAAYTYDPITAGLFKEFQPQAVRTLMQLIRDPFGTPFFQLGMGRATEAARGFGSRLFENLYGNLAAGGFGGADLPAYLQSQIGRIGRAQGRLEAQTLRDFMLAQQAPWLMALQAGMGYQPLAVGQVAGTGAGRRQPALPTAPFGSVFLR